MNLSENNKDILIHPGFVSKINDDSVVVTLEENVHCDACHAKGACGVSESSTKEIEVTNTTEFFKINERVDVILKKSLGLKAVFLAYVFPFVLMFLTLIIGSSFIKEWQAGLMALLILLPYFLMLYFLKNKLKTAFKISILKI